MSIRSFFKRKDGLPDPKGSLSTCLSSQAISLANKEVEKVTSEKGIGKQRGRTDREHYGAPSHTPVTASHISLYNYVVASNAVKSLQLLHASFSSATCLKNGVKIFS